ncbi:hypothetical protein K458DRAFT_144400 [Lentithecium fluviatile CBS 122367]|uniref:Uncharacterized protein n=1 Tax=Lentithecium fluviatile CBS 122367 TaxID=1168545 RepID=A0A6G1IJ84_9PLEO|nr:hypothetical protein K458DRAFT_144400 [Lentithecium fluviatile CBS 122367]
MDRAASRWQNLSMVAGLGCRLFPPIPPELLLAFFLFISFILWIGGWPVRLIYLGYSLMVAWPSSVASLLARTRLYRLSFWARCDISYLRAFISAPDEVGCTLYCVCLSQVWTGLDITFLMRGHFFYYYRGYSLRG